MSVLLAAVFAVKQRVRCARDARATVHYHLRATRPPPHPPPPSYVRVQGAITAVLRLPTGQTTESIKVLNANEAVIRIKFGEVRRSGARLEAPPLARHARCVPDIPLCHTSCAHPLCRLPARMPPFATIFPTCRAT